MVDALDAIERMRVLLLVPDMPIPRALVDEVVARGRRGLAAVQQSAAATIASNFPPVVLGRLDMVANG